MKDFGIYLCNLRSSMGLSLEQLAGLVGSSRSALSRLENNEVPKPFRGSARKLVLNLAEILCISRKETERYLDLAEINRNLLTEMEEFQLGFMPDILADSPEQSVNLERWKCICEQFVQKMEKKKIKIASSGSPLPLEIKIQMYNRFLQEIQHKIGEFHNEKRKSENKDEQKKQINSVNIGEERVVVGYMYGEEKNISTTPGSLYTLASLNAIGLMNLADVDCFAVDDMMVLTQSKNFNGWDHDTIITTHLNMPLPIPDDIEALRREKLPAIEKNFVNSSHYRLYSYTPAFSDRKALEVTVAPLGFHDYYTLLPFLDEPLLPRLDGSKISIRQKYGNTAFTYNSMSHETCLIPAPISLQCVLITQDQKIVLMQRSMSVAFYPGHWSASFEETMDAPGLDPKGNISRTGDVDFFACAVRGLAEEFGISADAIESIKILSLNIEYFVLAVGVVAIIEVKLTAKEVQASWLLKAPDKDEASRFATISSDLPSVIDKLFTKMLWHPTSRMRLIQFLFHKYGIDEVTCEIDKRNIPGLGITLSQ